MCNVYGTRITITIICTAIRSCAGDCAGVAGVRSGACAGEAEVLTFQLLGFSAPRHTCLPVCCPVRPVSSPPIGKKLGFLSCPGKNKEVFSYMGCVKKNHLAPASPYPQGTKKILYKLKFASSLFACSCVFQVNGASSPRAGPAPRNS